MSFNHSSLERLRKLGRQLPEPLSPPSENPKEGRKGSHSHHPVEREENPQELFKELMKISPDGTVPPHLISRLKEVEVRQFQNNQQNQIQRKIDSKKKSANPSKTHNKNTYITRGNSRSSSEEENALYVDFQRLLLEDEDTY